MSATELITQLRTDGYSISVEGSYLDISPAEGLSQNLVEKLKRSKPEILCALHQEEELKKLVLLVSSYHGFNQEDYEEALTHALADPLNALICFTSLARQAKLL